jgi:23S rRNA (pseudouridine1915-N3)-methyltransferase
MKIIALGSIDKIFEDKISFYLKQMKDISIIELRDYKDSSFINKEGISILNLISDDDYVISLEIEGKLVSTIELKDLVNNLNDKKLVFVIGGSFGLSESVKKRANYHMSLSKMTFSHAISRLILVEQLYRVQMINKGHPYHK